MTHQNKIWSDKRAQCKQLGGTADRLLTHLTGNWRMCVNTLHCEIESIPCIQFCIYVAHYGKISRSSRCSVHTENSHIVHSTYCIYCILRFFWLHTVDSCSLKMEVESLITMELCINYCIRCGVVKCRPCPSVLPTWFDSRVHNKSSRLTCQGVCALTENIWILGAWDAFFFYLVKTRIKLFFTMVL